MILRLVNAHAPMDTALIPVRQAVYIRELIRLPQLLAVRSTLITTAYHLANAILGTWRAEGVASHTTKAVKTSMAITPTEIAILVIVRLVINGTRQELHACRSQPSYVLSEQHNRVRVAFAPPVLFIKADSVFQTQQTANYLSVVTS